MKVLLAAINAKYIHSNLGIYSLKTYGEKMLKEWGLAEQAEISLAEYTINHQMEQILQDIYKRKPDVIGFSCSGSCYDGGRRAHLRPFSKGAA